MVPSHVNSLRSRVGWPSISNSSCEVLGVKSYGAVLTNGWTSARRAGLTPHAESSYSVGYLSSTPQSTIVPHVALCVNRYTQLLDIVPVSLCPNLKSKRSKSAIHHLVAE